MSFTPETLGPYLSNKLAKHCEIIEVEKFSRGSSRETWFITYHAGAASEQVVFRCDPITGSVDYTPLAQEYFMYERMGHTKVPVARALWWEDDPALNGRPFYVRQHVGGNWNIAHYKDPSPEYDDLRIRISKEHMSKLALVHAVDWKSLGLDKRLCTAPSREQCTPHYIDAIAAAFEDLRIARRSLSR